MELKFKRVNGRGITKIVSYMPRVPCQTIYEPDRYVFVPISQPNPQWRVAQNVVPGSYVLEAFGSETGNESLFMWDLPHQTHFQHGEEIFADTCTAAR